MTGSVAWLLAVLLSSASAGEDARVVFGEDDRRDLGELSESAALRAMRSTAVMVHQANLIRDEGEWLLRGESYAKRHGLCANVRFAEQPAPGLCSGFLAGPERMVTAGHCMRQAHDCTNNFWLFDFAVASSGAPRLRFHDSQVYRCVEILEQRYDPAAGLDFAVIRLDRAVTDREALPLQAGAVALPGERVAMSGHPGGLPAKWTGGGRVTGAFGPTLFSASLDAFGGNSGSPVFLEGSDRVEGILIAGGGHEDFQQEPGEACLRPKRYPDAGASGVLIQRIGVMSHALGTQ
ncbi:MAG: trypsin-like peptidase domain-containing protein [Bdellovibrionales bacterium]|nr:trypsin-like peptidase domain-containing protein [Bdellovibrionales bacterium]